MKVTKFKELKAKSKYQRNYDENGRLKSIDVYLPEIYEIFDKKKVWSAIKWLNEQNSHARLDITAKILANDLAKYVVTSEERKLVRKERYLFSWNTFQNLELFVARWYEHFKNQGLIEYDIVPSMKKFIKGDYQKRYETLEVTAKLTEEGKKRRNDLKRIKKWRLVYNQTVEATDEALPFKKTTVQE